MIQRLSWDNWETSNQSGKLWAFLSASFHRNNISNGLKPERKKLKKNCKISRIYFNLRKLPSLSYFNLLQIRYESISKLQETLSTSCCALAVEMVACLEPVKCQQSEISPNNGMLSRIEYNAIFFQTSIRILCPSCTSAVANMEIERISSWLWSCCFTLQTALLYKLFKIPYHHLITIQTF